MTFASSANLDLDWKPLEALLTPGQCHAFMFTGYAYQARPDGSTASICKYKNADTRRYLNVSPDGQCWQYDATVGPAGVYRPIARQDAIKHAFS